jgi:quinol-cytochrome oxidoreductase complex cytochrome b subunit
MYIILKKGTSQKDVKDITEHLRKLGYTPDIIESEKTVISVSKIGALERKSLEKFPQIEKIVSLLKSEDYREIGHPFFPNHLLKEAIVAYLIIGILVTLAILMPFQLHEKANPLETPTGIKPEWYFLGVYQLLKYIPKNLGTIGFILAIIILFFWPLIDRGKERHPKKRRKVVIFGTIVLIGLIILTILGWLSESTKTIFGRKYEFDIKGIPHKVIEHKEESH